MLCKFVNNILKISVTVLTIILNLNVLIVVLSTLSFLNKMNTNNIVVSVLLFSLSLVTTKNLPTKNSLKNPPTPLTNVKIASQKLLIKLKWFLIVEKYSQGQLCKVCNFYSIAKLLQVFKCKSIHCSLSCVLCMALQNFCICYAQCTILYSYLGVLCKVFYIGMYIC